jgi:hypothetical protein
MATWSLFAVYFTPPGEVPKNYTHPLKEGSMGHMVRIVYFMIRILGWKRSIITKLICKLKQVTYENSYVR